MKRLTEKRVIHPSCTVDGVVENREYIHIEDKNAAEKKLFELENIEESLGIDLTTLYKALKNGIYVKTKCGISHHYTVHLMKWQQTKTYCLYYRPYSHIWMEDYGKTWALTEEELQDGRQKHRI